MKTLFIYLIIGGSAIAVGGGTGVIVKRVFTEPEKDYSNFDVSIYDIDGDEYIARFEAYSNKKVAYNSSTPLDIAIYATEKYKRCDNCYSFGTGLAVANALGIKVYQDIRNCQIKNGDNYFEESVSASNMVQVANRYIQNGIDSDVIVQYAENGDVVIDASVCNYHKVAEGHFTQEGFIAAYGRLPSEMFNYIIHELTITSAEKKEVDNGNYEITLVTNPDLATYKYQSQMSSISSLSSRPTFSSCVLVFTVDSELNLVSLNVSESYVAEKSGFGADTVGNLYYRYFPNQYYEIPDVDTNFDYVGEMSK